MLSANIIQHHRRPSVIEIDLVAKQLISLPSSPTKDKLLSKIYFLSLSHNDRQEIWKSSEIRRYFFHAQLEFLGWIAEDFSVLHIAVTGETPYFERHT